MTDSYNLLTERWIPVRRMDQRLDELSLVGVLEQAHVLREVVGELPTQAFALTRILLAVLHRSVEVDDPRETWAQLWEADRLPVEAVDAYLERWRDRFDLLHPDTPFFQVAGLRTAKDEMSPLSKIVADVPNNEPYFATRSGASLASVSFAEAARWLVHAQAFDPSGIKSGAVDDPRVKGGKGYPIGIAWSGNLGGLMLEGGNLRETLLLNLTFGRYATGEARRADDRPAWERAPFTASVEARDGAPAGPADLFTWQSRRVRLGHDDSRVTGVLISNGDPLSAEGLYEHEPMTAWRRSPTREKKGAGGPVYMPRTHVPARSLWRGLEGLLGRTLPAAASETGLRPGVLDWAGHVGEELGREYVLRTRAIGMEYVNNASVVGEVMDDALVVHAHLVGDRAERHTGAAVEAVRRTDQAVRALGDLAGNLSAAAGGEMAGPRERAKELGYFGLDRPFREWLATLAPGTDPDSELRRWCATARSVVALLGEQLVDDAGPAAWRGRQGDKTWLWAPAADRWFRRALHRALDVETSDPPDGSAATPTNEGAPA